MEKILLAIDATNPDKNALEFACYLGRLTKSKITGVILENLVSEERPVLKSMEGMHFADWTIDENSEENKAKMEQIKNSITFFKEGCISRCVGYNLHRDTGVPAHELIEESRFADIV